MSDLCKNFNSFFIKNGLENVDMTNIELAFTHPSYSIENNMSKLECYERLEFLGDAVLKLIVSDILYKKFPDSSEGKMTLIRSILVSDDFLLNLAEDLNLKKYIKMSKALEKDGGRNNPSISACVFEAILGYLYENGVEIPKISEFLKNLYAKYIENLNFYMPKFNSKAILQEYTQSINKDRPEYKLIAKTGSENDTVFTVNVYYQGKELGSGIGKSKKQAEREAAYQACLRLKLNGEHCYD